MDIYNKQGIKDNEQLIYNDIKRKVKIYKIKLKIVIAVKYLTPTIIFGILLRSIVFN